MKAHKCLLCDTIYFSNEEGYYGYCSDICRTASEKRESAEREVTPGTVKEVR